MPCTSLSRRSASAPQSHRGGEWRKFCRCALIAPAHLSLSLSLPHSLAHTRPHTLQVSEISMLLIAWSADVGCPLPWELALQIAEVSLSGSCGHGLPLSGTCCCDGAGVDQAVRVDVVHPERWLREGRSPSPRPSPITTASAAASSTVRHVLKKSRPPGRAVRGATVCSACGGWTSVVCRSKAVVTGAAAHLRPIQITCAPVRWKDCRHYQLNPDDPSVASRHRLSSWHNFRTVSLQEWVVCGQARYVIAVTRTRRCHSRLSLVVHGMSDPTPLPAWRVDVGHCRYIVSFPQLRRPWAVAVGCITPHAAVNLHNNWAPGLPGTVHQMPVCLDEYRRPAPLLVPTPFVVSWCNLLTRQCRGHLDACSCRGPPRRDTGTAYCGLLYRSAGRRDGDVRWLETAARRCRVWGCRFHRLGRRCSLAASGSTRRDHRGDDRRRPRPSCGGGGRHCNVAPSPTSHIREGRRTASSLRRTQVFGRRRHCFTTVDTTPAVNLFLNTNTISTPRYVVQTFRGFATKSRRRGS